MNNDPTGWNNWPEDWLSQVPGNEDITHRPWLIEAMLRVRRERYDFTWLDMQAIYKRNPFGCLQRGHATEIRSALAYHLRESGLSLPIIAEILGMKSHTAIHSMVIRERDRRRYAHAGSFVDAGAGI